MARDCVEFFIIAVLDVPPTPPLSLYFPCIRFIKWEKCEIATSFLWWCVICSLIADNYKRICIFYLNFFNRGKTVKGWVTQMFNYISWNLPWGLGKCSIYHPFLCMVKQFICLVNTIGPYILFSLFNNFIYCLIYIFQLFIF